MLSPVLAIALFRRPAYTRQLFDALSQCEGIEKIPIVISQDWSDEHSEACGGVNVLSNAFLSTHAGELHVQQPKLGIDLNKLFVIPKAFERGNFVIFLEDDHIASKDALRWFIEMGERFESDEQIGFITGYSRQSEEAFRASSPNDIGFAGIGDGEAGFNPSGWATWKDRWDYFFPDGGREYRMTCGEQANGLFDHYMHLRHGELLYKHERNNVTGVDKPKWPGLVGPKIARIRLIGWENAEHTPSEEYFLEHEFNEWGMWSL
jgi:hypothetical protein